MAPCGDQAHNTNTKSSSCELLFFRSHGAHGLTLAPWHRGPHHIFLRPGMRQATSAAAVASETTALAWCGLYAAVLSSCFATASKSLSAGYPQRSRLLLQPPRHTPQPISPAPGKYGENPQVYTWGYFVRQVLTLLSTLRAQPFASLGLLREPRAAGEPSHSSGGSYVARAVGIAAPGRNKKEPRSTIRSWQTLPPRRAWQGYFAYT